MVLALTRHAFAESALVPGLLEQVDSRCSCSAHL